MKTVIVFGHSSGLSLALAKFTRDLQKALANTPSRVMDFCPSGFQSDIYKSMTGDQIDRDESVQIKVEDLVDLIVYLPNLPIKIEVASIWVNRK